ncbi:MAG: hypothetical protein ACPGDB_02575, partial [Fusobacterium sp.]
DLLEENDFSVKVVNLEVEEEFVSEPTLSKHMSIVCVQGKLEIERERAYIAEINLSLLERYMKKKSKYEKVVKYPEVSRDLAIVLEENILVGEMITAIEKSSSYIESVNLFDIYKGEHIEKGKKSVAIGIILRKKEGTLSEEEILKVQEKVLSLIEKKFKGEIRK